MPSITDTTATQATLIAALVALSGAVTAATLTFISNVGVRQQAIREADLAAKLDALDVDAERDEVKKLLAERVNRWTTRGARAYDRLYLWSTAFTIVLFLGASGLMFSLVNGTPGEATTANVSAAFRNVLLHGPVGVIYLASCATTLLSVFFAYKARHAK